MFGINKLFPQIDKVSATQLNVRSDSTTSATSLGILKYNQKIAIQHYGKDWLQLAPTQKIHVPKSKREQFLQYSGSLFVSSHYVEKGYKDLTNNYIALAVLLHLICYLVLLVACRENFIQVFWNQMFATNTIPLGILMLISLITDKLFRKKQLSSEPA